MKSWDALPDVALNPDGEITAAFLSAGVLNFCAAACFLGALPYGRNSSRTDPLIVIRERCGTCSTKHALLKRLAIEQQLELTLMIGIYEMTDRNTPGVGAVLANAGLSYIPEAHCYVRFLGERIDVTRTVTQAPPEEIAAFLHEEEISPDQIGDYKIAMHQRYLRDWIASPRAPHGLDFDTAWRIREDCIASLSQPPPPR